MLWFIDCGKIVKMAQINFRGVVANYHKLGEGRPVICLHSGGNSGRQWKKLAEALAGQYLLIAPDLLGFGETGDWLERGKLSHELQAELVADVATAEGGFAFDVVGHSYGGATAIRLCLKYPHLVRSLVLIEPVMNCLLRDARDPLYEQSIQVAHRFIEAVRAGRPEEGWQAFVDGANGVGTWEKMPEDGKSRFLSQSTQTVEGFISNLNNPTTLDECRTIARPSFHSMWIGNERTISPHDRIVACQRAGSPIRRS